MTTGERIRARRKELGITADYLAEVLNVSRSTIFRYENGDIEKMPMSILEPISKVLNTTPAFLMGWDDDDFVRVVGGWMTKKDLAETLGFSEFMSDNSKFLIVNSDEESFLLKYRKLCRDQQMQLQGYLTHMLHEAEAAEAAKQIKDA
ncbi:MAG: XRE family transcriptional regulator [Clostridia bacterium]|nr:XRE family transcriptional regulator [Clostridia bacterium]